MIIRNCFNCTKEFETYPCWVIRGESKYCSRSCSGKATWKVKGLIPFKKGQTGLRKGIRMFKDENPNWRGGKPKCLDCGKEVNYNYKRCKECSLLLQKGSNNPNWRGGVTPINEAIRKSEEYAIWRTAVLMRDHYTCQDCGHEGGNLHVDHIKPFSTYPELRLAIDNGRTLCIECHRKTDTWGKGALLWREQ